MVFVSFDYLLLSCCSFLLHMNYAMNAIMGNVSYILLWSDKHICMSPLSNTRVQPIKGSAVCHYSLNYSNWPSSEYFSVLFHKNRKRIFKLKVSLFTIWDGPSLTRNICPTSLPVYFNDLLSSCLIHSANICDHFSLIFICHFRSKKKM